MIHLFLNGIEYGFKYSWQTLLIFSNIRYITVSDEFNVLTSYIATRIPHAAIHSLLFYNFVLIKNDTSFNQMKKKSGNFWREKKMF